jgi:ribose transport system substrate-binding protein
MKTRLRRGFDLPFVGVVGAVTTACGSSSKSTATNSSPTATNSSLTTATAGASTSADAGIAAAKAFVTPFETAPSDIGTTAAPTRKPPKKKMVFIACADPSCATLATYMQGAAAALGWDDVTINATATDPRAAIRQAIDAGANYIGETPKGLFFLVSTPEQARPLVAQKAGWSGPDGYQDAFKKLSGM